MQTAPTPDQQLQNDVDALRAQFSNTAELYRETCALMFFRYGQTPTANRLYQLVRKGSMSAPAAALGAFWNSLREQSRVKIDHADMPDGLKNAAAELTMSLWREAKQHAEQTFDAQRSEAADALAQTLTRLGSVQAELEDLQKLHAEQQDALQQARAQHLDAVKEADELRERLSAETAAHRESINVRDAYAKAQQQAASLREADLREAFAARESTLREALAEVQAGLAAAHEDHRRALSAAHAESRDALSGIQARFDAQHKHNLLELDRERMRAAQLDKALMQAQTQLGAKTEAAAAEAAKWHDQSAQWQGKLGALEGRLAAISEERVRADEQRAQEKADAQAAIQAAVDSQRASEQEVLNLRKELASLVEQGRAQGKQTEARKQPAK
ncbi:hypothetical protein FXN63_13770 [Pigmentiphaga aceris]|uniref:KfrA N-terminal DNA-binding domain-containing protein n=1 Tax=Pigmentiphaga aceris TaxID=1940612 RepID=A0A5C0B205_9BURK|nr:DNA-binding protein [Pigmentiphaga aceris]QEI06781.1 hypothetical protein FXN63_13770 [Pigmentiphaga aceris]